MSEEAVLSWKVHPVKRSLKASIGVILLLLVIWAAVYFAMQSFLFLMVAVVVMLVSLWGFFLPTEYELYPDKIKVRYVMTSLEKEWKNYRSFYVDKSGVLLSPFTKPSRLENFRGIYLKIDRDSQMKDKIVDYIKSKIGSSVECPQ